MIWCKVSLTRILLRFDFLSPGEGRGLRCGVEKTSAVIDSVELRVRKRPTNAFDNGPR